MTIRDALEGRRGSVWRIAQAIWLAALLVHPALPALGQDPASTTPAEPAAPAEEQEPQSEQPAAQPTPPPLGPAERDALAKLQSAKPAVRREGIERLGELKSRGASGDIARLAASDPDPSVRRAALVALGRIRDVERIPDMTTALADQDVSVRLGAVQGLVGLYLDGDDGAVTRVRSTIIAVIPFWDEERTWTVEPYDVVDPRVTTALAETLKRDADPKVRVACVRALGALRASSELDSLADAMTADEKLRPEVLDTFVLIGAVEAASYAIPFFEHPDEKLAAQAMLAAGRLRSPRAVVPLLNVYNTKEGEAGLVESVKRKVTFAPERRKVVVQALALLGDARAEKVFYDNMYDKDPEVRRSAYEGLGREADPRFFDVVTRNKLIERDESVRLAQMFALYKMGHPELFGNLVDALTSRARRDQGFQYILETDSPEHLLPYARMRDQEIQKMVIEALGRIGDERTAQELQAFRRGTTPEIAGAATRAVRRIEWRLGQQAQPIDSARPRRVGEP